MAMGAHTGCNTVFGSTPPNNPHPYPWMNSLFQDGATVAWLFGEAFVQDHARRSVIPERLADALLARGRERADGRRVLRPRPLHRRPDDRPRGGRAAEGVGHRRRRRDGRHRLPERLEGRPPEPAEREAPDARHAGLLEHGRAELRLVGHHRRVRHEPDRRGHAGQADREEGARRDLLRGPRLALRRAGLDGERPEALQGDPRRPRVPRDGVRPELHPLPARARRRRRRLHAPVPARPRLPDAPRVHVQPRQGRDVPRGDRGQGEPEPRPATGGRRRSSRRARRSATPSPTTPSPRPASAST